MNPAFHEMVDEQVEVQITLDKEDPNVSRSEIMLKGGKTAKLIRKSDLSDRIIDMGFKNHDPVETDPQDSPGHFKDANYDHTMTGKSDRDIGVDFDEATSGIVSQKDPESHLPLVNYFVPLLVSPNSLFDIFITV